MARRERLPGSGYGTLKKMSAKNGDKSRFGRQRKQKINRRKALRALRTTLVESKAAKSK
jgi:hypothetical protein